MTVALSENTFHVVVQEDTRVSVTEEVVSIISVGTQGPPGPQGPQGPAGSGGGADEDFVIAMATAL